MAIRKPKTGRRAGENDRQIAKELVDEYRKAQAQPGGKLCLNPQDDPDEQTWLDGNDPEHLLRILEGFSEHGTFEQVGPTMDSIRLLPLRMEYSRRRDAGERVSAILNDLADRYCKDPKTIDRLIQGKKQ